MNPSSVYFDDVIKLKPLEYEEIKLTKKISYWNINDPFFNDGFEKFREFISCNPIWRMNNEDELEDTNPFSTIHLPTFSTNQIFNLLTLFVRKNLNINYQLNYNDWGNLYFKDKCRPIKKWRLPHMDYVGGIVANLWLTDHLSKDSGTILYEYTGKTHGIFYDFQIDESHKLYKEWHNFGNRDRQNFWSNFSTDEALYWGFNPVGLVPSKYNCMTCYLPNISHTPFISNHIDFRWSHTFCAYY